MIRVSRLVALTVLVAVVMASAGCAAALVGRAADAGTAGRSSAPAAADRALEETIRRRLAADPGTKAIPVLVECRAGAVTLRGLVKSPAERAAPERVVRSVPGVVSVRNELRVR